MKTSVKRSGAQPVGDWTPRKPGYDQQRFTKKAEKLKWQRSRRASIRRGFVRVQMGPLHRGTYDIPLAWINCPEKLRDWVGHLAPKNWFSSRHRADLIACVSRQFGWGIGAFRCLPPRESNAEPAVDMERARVFFAQLLTHLAQL